MPQSESETELVRILARHFVLISYSCTHPETHKIEPVNFSGFVMSFDGYPFLITVGHALEEYESYVKAGYNPTLWSICDNFGIDAQHQETFLFDYVNEPKLWRHDAIKGIDYAAIPLSDYYASLLARNGIEPLSEHHWKDDFPETFDSYYILGVPAETIKPIASGDMVMSEIYLLEVRPESNPPDNLNKPYLRFYGKTVDADQEDAPQSIRGMSGGPIFGFKLMGNGKVRYWAIAIQSAWLPRERIIAAFYLKPLTAKLQADTNEIERRLRYGSVANMTYTNPPLQEGGETRVLDTVLYTFQARPERLE